MCVWVWVRSVDCESLISSCCLLCTCQYPTGLRTRTNQAKSIIMPFCVKKRGLCIHMFSGFVCVRWWWCFEIQVSASRGLSVCVFSFGFGFGLRTATGSLTIINMCSHEGGLSVAVKPANELSAQTRHSSSYRRMFSEGNISAEEMLLTQWLLFHV